MNTTAGRPQEPKDRFAFDRWDRLGMAALLGLISLATGVVALARPVVAWSGGDDLAVPFASPIQVPELDAAGQPYGEGEYDLAVNDPTTAQRVLDLAPGLLVLALVLAACWLVFRLMRDIGAGQPFAARNVTRLRLLAAILIFGVPIAAFARLACTGAIVGGLDLGGLPPAAWFEIPWLPVVLGGFVALLAEAFKTGARLRDDVDGLV